MTERPRRKRVRLEPATRLPRLEPAVVVGVLVLGGLILAWELYISQGPELPEGTPRSLCLVRNVTGVPCPGCGGTRAVKSALALNPLEALAHNPLLVLGGVCLGGALLLRLVTAHTLRFSFTQQGWVVVAIVFALLVLMNWTWVLARHDVITF
jgi:hypothetical protein